MLSTLEELVLDGYLEGKSYREMSTEMRCVPKTIDNALQRVKRKIEANAYARLNQILRDLKRRDSSITVTGTLLKNESGFFLEVRAFTA